MFLLRVTPQLSCSFFQLICLEWNPGKHGRSWCLRRRLPQSKGIKSPSHCHLLGAREKMILLGVPWKQASGDLSRFITVLLFYKPLCVGYASGLSPTHSILYVGSQLLCPIFNLPLASCMEGKGCSSPLCMPQLYAYIQVKGISEWVGLLNSAVTCTCTLNSTLTFCFKNRRGRISLHLNWVLKKCMHDIPGCTICPASSAEPITHCIYGHPTAAFLTPASTGPFPLHIFYLQQRHWTRSKASATASIWSRV